MRYTYQQRQDRRENQGDVSEEGAGETWGGGAVDIPSSDVPSCPFRNGSIPTALSQGAILGLPYHSGV